MMDKDKMERFRRAVKVREEAKRKYFKKEEERRRKKIRESFGIEEK